MKSVTVESQLNCKAFRADFPKMRDESFNAAIKLSAYVSAAMYANSSKQFYISFVALRKVLPMNCIRGLCVVGPKLMDFQSVIQEASGLGVVMVNEGLWFLSMLGRHPVRGEATVTKFVEHFNAVTDKSSIFQFVEDDEDEDEKDAQ